MVESIRDNKSTKGYNEVGDGEYSRPRRFRHRIGAGHYGISVNSGGYGSFEDDDDDFGIGIGGRSDNRCRNFLNDDCSDSGSGGSMTVTRENSTASVSIDCCDGGGGGNSTINEADSDVGIMNRNSSDSSSTDLVLDLMAVDDRHRRAAEIERRKEEAKKKRRKKRQTGSLVSSCFQDLYKLTGEILGEGAYASVQTCVNMYTNLEFAVKIIEKIPGHPRARVFREIETFHHCTGHPNIIQLFEFFEDDERFYLVFEKIVGGPLLRRIQENDCFTEAQAAAIVYEIASALNFLHAKGIAHRDLKPENILCVSPDSLCPIKLCDFDLGSGIRFQTNIANELATPQLMTPVGSADFMAPEVVDAFLGEANFYDKRCDLWSLGVIMYILLFGCPPFTGKCGMNCGWERGENCTACQKLLFVSIQEGKYDFPNDTQISNEAKQLIGSLLLKEPSRRLSADAILKHPWFQLAKTNLNILETPDLIKRNNAAKELSQFAESCMAVKRVVLQHFSLGCDYMNSSSDKVNTTTLQSPKTTNNNNVNDSSNVLNSAATSWRIPKTSPSDQNCMTSLANQLKSASIDIPQKSIMANVASTVVTGLSPPSESFLLKKRMLAKKYQSCHGQYESPANITKSRRVLEVASLRG